MSKKDKSADLHVPGTREKTRRNSHAFDFDVVINNGFKLTKPTQIVRDCATSRHMIKHLGYLGLP